jgi:D-glycero-alpha-D-manno-heptose-7-phosphate kinase
VSAILVARAPLRISFGGGGTDLPAYYEQHGGLVVSATISYYTYAILTPGWSDDIQITFADHRAIQGSTDRDSIWDRGLQLPKAVASYFQIDSGLDIFLASEVPPGAGLGYSGSVAVTMIKALAFWCGLDLGPAEVAELACYIEIDKMEMPVGKHDQYAVAFGGLNCIRFSRKEVIVEPLKVSYEVRDALERRTLLFFTGSSRQSTAIMRRQEQAIRAGERATLAGLHAINELGSEIHAALERGDMVAFGELLHKSWMNKRELVQGITNEFLDQCYQIARENGATGGGLTGAGGGGFMMFYCPEEYQAAVTGALEALGLQRRSFRLDTDGVQVMEASPRPRVPVLRTMVGRTTSGRLGIQVPS